MKLPKLSLRELFLLVVIAAMACGGWVERGKLISSYESRLEEQETQIQIDGGTIHELQFKLDVLKFRVP